MRWTAPYPLVLMILSLGFAAPGCGDTNNPAAEDESDATGTGSDSDASSGSVSTDSSSATSSDGTDADSGESTDTSTTDGGTDTGGDPPEPSALCDEVLLPDHGGAEIIVSPGSDGMVMVDGSAMTLRQAVSSANAGDTLLLADGTYLLPEAGPGNYSGLYFTQPNVTLRSQSGDPDAVVIDGGYRSQGDGTAPITIAASGVVIADLTVRQSIFHLIHIWADGDGALIHNVHLIDGGQQFLKSSVNDGSVDDVEISCTSFTMTANGRDNVWGYGPQDGGTRCYTGGIDTHNARNWHVHDSFFEGIYCDATGVPRPAHGQFPELRNDMTYNGGLAEHGIHMWDSEQGTGHLIERNRIVDCARGIGIGLVDTVYGSEVVNNMVVSQHAGSGEHDVGIIVERAVDTLVAHNSVFFTHPDAYPNAIEYRWGETSNLTLHANLTNQDIRDRDGAVATETDNVSDADGSWFTDPATGDLHLEDCASGPAANHVDAVSEDYDGETRPMAGTQAGADACSP